MFLFHSHIDRLREKTARRLDAYTKEQSSFYFLIAAAAAIAAMGLLLNNASIIIGAMVVAPLITPVFGFSLGLILLRGQTIFRTLLAITLGSLLALLVAYTIGILSIFLEGTVFTVTNEMFTRTDPNIWYFLIAILSGMAGAFGYTRPQVVESITGIAISVAVIPPIAVTGLALSIGNDLLLWQSLFLYLFNLAGICFGSIIMFLILGFGKTE